MASNVPYAPATKLKDLKKQLDFVAFFLTDKWNDTYLSLAFVHGGSYTTLLDTAVKVTKWGFWAKKNF